MNMRTTTFLSTLGLGVMLSSVSASDAQVPTYTDFELQARSNIVDGFNLPAGSSFNSGTPSLNDAGDFAFRLIVNGSTGRSALWYGGGGAGAIVFDVPNVDLLARDPDVGPGGEAIFDVADFGGTIGLHLYDPSTNTTSMRIAPGGPFGTTFFTAAELASDGSIGWRSSNSVGDYAYVAELDEVQVRYAAMADIDPSSPYSFLFTPSFNDSRRIAAKVRLGNAGQFGSEQPDQIRVFDPDGTSIMVAEDRDGDPDSPFTGFDNGVTLSDTGWVAFVANLASGGRGVYAGNGSVIVEIATTGDPVVSEVEFFHPAVNDEGLVAFRGKDGQGLDAVFVGDGTTLRRVIGEHDLLPTDLGVARIDQHDNSVTFGGSVDINDHGDIAFNATLTPADNNQVEWGSGMFIAYADPTSAAAPITALSFIFGALERGDAGALVESDDVFLEVRSQFGFAATEPNIVDLRVDFDGSDLGGSTLSVRFEGRLDNPGGTTALRLRNWNAKQLESIGTFSIGNTETTKVFDGLDASRYVRIKDGLVRLRVRQSVIATFSASGFRTLIDQIEIRSP